MIPTHMLDDGTVVEATDKSLRVQFFYLPVENKMKSKEAGRPIYEDVEMVEIKIPGSRDLYHFKAEEKYINRFPKQYAAFKQSTEAKMEGTPLSQFPFITASERKEFEYHNIYTAEQLCNMADGLKDRVGMHTRDIIKKVSAFLKSAKDTSALTALVDENEHLKREMELIKQQMKQLLTLKEEEKDDGKIHRRKGRKRDEYEAEVRAA